MARKGAATDWTFVSKSYNSAGFRYKDISSSNLKCSYVSVFVDNLPFEMDVVWLRQLFRSFGDVVDAYIPNKRSSRFNTKFGFVRFRSKDEAVRAVHAMNGFLIRDFCIQVNLARFSQPNSSKNFVQKPGVSFVSSKNPAISDSPINIIKCNDVIDDNCPSFADVVAGKKSTVSRNSIKVQEEDIEWLMRSAIAKLPSQRSVESLREAFISDGVWNIKIRQLGGNSVLLTFESVEDMEAMLDGGEVKSGCVVGMKAGDVVSGRNNDLSDDGDGSHDLSPTSKDALMDDHEKEIVVNQVVPSLSVENGQEFGDSMLNEVDLQSVGKSMPNGKASCLKD
ncbi:hypothetical protein Vadar_030021 [Vaccinium darrowii]|uniref:Uncharacterized protein n=1 Tax=Vaccinium darrowii TaxID=229202 RepID=A0ACB7Y4A6_9ERIC|nr:hypothetical protein Vadar_030021 [Vaccinium darrowii]